MSSRGAQSTELVWILDFKQILLLLLLLTRQNNNFFFFSNFQYTILGELLYKERMRGEDYRAVTLNMQLLSEKKEKHICTNVHGNMTRTPLPYQEYKQTKNDYAI